MWGSTIGCISALLIQNARVCNELVTSIHACERRTTFWIFFKVPEVSAAQLLSFKWSRCRIFVGSSSGGSIPSERGGRSSRSWDKGGGGPVPKEFFFGPSAWSKNKRWGRAPQAPALDPSLGSEVKSQPEESGKWVREKWCWVLKEQ